jgi:hypothetical protein
MTLPPAGKNSSEQSFTNQADPDIPILKEVTAEYAEGENWGKAHMSRAPEAQRRKGRSRIVPERYYPLSRLTGENTTGWNMHLTR